MALKRLQSEYKQLVVEPNYMFSIDVNHTNFFEWNISLFGTPDTYYEGGIFKCKLTFPKEYPNKPPIFQFNEPIYHPNFYKDGKVCISILHEGKDEYGYESSNERWLPSHSITTILLSISTLFASPNFDSPADVDASLEWRNNPESYKKKIYALVAKTQK